MKKTMKKLVLAKETVRNITELAFVRGGEISANGYGSSCDIPCPNEVGGA